MILRNLRTLWCSEWALDDKLHFGKLQSVEKKKKRNQLAWACRKLLHRLPDALCQQVRALIDLRLPNCTLIKERSCSVPFFLLILTLFIWFWRGHSWPQCVDRSVSGALAWVYFPSDASFSCHGEIWEAQRGISGTSQRGPTCNRQEWETRQRSSHGAIKSTLMKERTKRDRDTKAFYFKIGSYLQRQYEDKPQHYMSDLTTSLVSVLFSAPLLEPGDSWLYLKTILTCPSDPSCYCSSCSYWPLTIYLPNVSDSPASVQNVFKCLSPVNMKLQPSDTWSGHLPKLQSFLYYITSLSSSQKHTGET